MTPLALPTASLQRHLAARIHAKSLTGIPDEYATPHLTQQQIKRRTREAKERERRQRLEWNLEHNTFYRVQIRGPKNAKLYCIASSTECGGVILTRLVEMSESRAKRKHWKILRQQGDTPVNTTVMRIDL